MIVTLYTTKLLALAQTLHRWLGAMAGLDQNYRARVADYAEAIAATLARAGSAFARLEANHDDHEAIHEAVRELGRMTGYVETIVAALEHQLDGRKLAGVKKRLEQLDVGQLTANLALATISELCARRDQLGAAEGYFRAFADGLRA
jgi:hypothetical protein